MSAVHSAQATHATPLGYAMAACVGLVIGVICACAILGVAKLVSARTSGDPSLARRALLIALFPTSIGCIVLADYCGSWITGPLLRMLG